jgi:AraC-like DNA-binding protein
LLQPSLALVTFPDMWHAYAPVDPDAWEEYHLLFAGNLFALLERDGLLRRDTPVLHLGDDEAAGACHREVRILVDAFMAGADPEDRVLLARIHLLLAGMAAAHERHRLAGTGELSRRACALFAEDLAGAVDTPAVAAACGLSYERFRKRFTQEMGVPPQRFRLQLQLEEAKRRLRATDAPIKKVAADLGFCNAHHFSRQFRRFVGLPPAEWRRRHAPPAG